MSNCKAIENLSRLRASSHRCTTKKPARLRLVGLVTRIGQISNRLQQDFRKLLNIFE